MANKWIGATLIMVLLLVGCGGDGEDPGESVAEGTAPAADPDAQEEETPGAEETAGEEAPQEVEQIRFLVGASGAINPLYAPMTTAMQMGYFEEEGLEIEFAVAEGTAATLAGMATGQGDYAALNAGPMMLQHAESGAHDVVYVCNWAYNIHWELAALPESTINSFEDIEAGDTIGVGSMGESQVSGVRQSLQRRGLEPDSDVVIQPLGTGATVGEALESGVADLFATWDVARVNVELAGYELKDVESPEEWGQLFGTGMGVHRDRLEENPEQVAGFCRALMKGNVFAFANPEAAVQMHWEVSPESKPPGSEEEAMELALRQMNARLSKSTPCGEATCEDHQLGETDPEQWQATLEFYGLEDQIDDPGVFYTLDLIEEINDFDPAEVQADAEAWEG